MIAQSEPLEIRRMSAADLPRAMEIAGPRYPRSTWLGMLNATSAPPRIALAAARPTGDLLGFAVASLLPPQAELESIAVDTANQRQGIGRRLLFGLIQELRQEHVQELWLEVRASNAPAIALYRSAGFSESGFRVRYYADPIEDALLMTLSIQPALGG